MTQEATVETGPAVTDWKQIGQDIIMCLHEREFDRLADRFHPQVTCRLLIPSGLVTPREVSTLMRNFRQWFGEADHFNIERSQIDQIGDRLHISYQIRLREAGLWYLVEQQTYSQLEGGTITRFDLLCSGFRLDNAAS